MQPEVLLETLLQIESTLGRKREAQSHRFGPRVIDLDLLLFGKEERCTEFLILPHPRMYQRAFVLIPLRDIAPELTFPDGKTLLQVLKNLTFRVEGEAIWQ